MSRWPGRGYCVVALVATSSLAQAAAPVFAGPAVSAFHPFRNLAAQVAPSLVPPKGCTRDVFALASRTRVAPDVTGCLPGAIQGFIRASLDAIPVAVPEGPDALSTPIVDQSPRPGQHLGRTFTLILASPAPAATVPTTTSATGATTADTQPSSAGGPPETAATTSPAPSAPDVPGTKTPTSKPAPATGDGAQAPSPTPPADFGPPPPPLATQLFDWFWDGLNPVWAAGLLLIAGWGAWRLSHPARLVLTGRPSVLCEIHRPGGFGPTWRDDRRIALNAPMLDLVLIRGRVAAESLQVIGERQTP